MKKDAAWQPERIQRLMALKDQGLSRPAIAEAMGITNNAVIGKLFRLGISRGLKGGPREADGITLAVSSRKRTPPPPPAPLPPVSCAPSTPNEEPKPDVPPDPPPPPPEPPIVVVAKPIVLAPRPRGCSWPTWSTKDAAYRAACRAGRKLECGDPVVRAAYCAAHAIMAYDGTARRIADA